MQGPGNSYPWFTSQLHLPLHYIADILTTLSTAGSLKSSSSDFSRSPIFNLKTTHSASGKDFLSAWNPFLSLVILNHISPASSSMGSYLCQVRRLLHLLLQFCELWCGYQVMFCLFKSHMCSWMGSGLKLWLGINKNTIWSICYCRLDLVMVKLW